MFDQLYGVDQDERVPVFWSTPGAREITEFVWDTNVVQVTEPWPTIEPQTVREAMAMIIGHNEVTGFLFTHQDMIDYEANHQQVKAPCVNCGEYCGDKWCGLRGNEEGEVIDGEVRTGSSDSGSGGVGDDPEPDRSSGEDAGDGVHPLQVPVADDGRGLPGAVEGGSGGVDAEFLDEEDSR